MSERIIQCLLLFFALININIGQTMQQSATTKSRLPLTSCEVAGVKGTVLCGTYEVFENRETKTGRKIPIKIVVLPALSETPLPDPLFSFAGGPGQAATDGAASDAQRFAEIRKERDIVLIDQRGTGGSNRLQCEFADLKETLEIFVGGSVPEGFVKRCREELEKKADLRFYTTPFALQDIDEIRAWLGYEKINIYGGSYGTRPALIYLRMFPNKVRTATLRAVAPQFMCNPLYSPRDAQNSLEHLFNDCEKEEACHLAFPNLRQEFQTILERLDKEPVKLTPNDPKTGKPLEVILTGNLFTGAIRRLLYDVGTQRSIPLVIHKAFNNDFSALSPVAAQTLNLTNALALGLNLSVTCAEDVSLIKESEIESETRGSFFKGELVQTLFNVCKEWTKGKLPKSYSAAVKSKTPVLLFSGTLDPQTPPVWGNAVAKDLPNSLHIVMEGIAHGPFPPCAIGLMNQFVKTGTTKGLDANCVRELKRPTFVLK